MEHHAICFFSSSVGLFTAAESVFVGEFVNMQLSYTVTDLKLKQVGHIAERLQAIDKITGSQ